MYLSHGPFTGSAEFYLSIFFYQANFTLTPDAQVWPQSLNAHFGGVASQILLIAVDIGVQSFDVVLSMTFLQRFYSVFDSGNNQVGLAQTPFTNAILNVNWSEVPDTSST